MLQFFMNPLMLIGLAGVALPVLAHLLSRRKFDVVNWGAMQFLNPSRKTRQKMRLEELLLLLVRIGIIALLGFALARHSLAEEAQAPWHPPAAHHLVEHSWV